MGVRRNLVVLGARCQILHEEFLELLGIQGRLKMESGAGVGKTGESYTNEVTNTKSYALIKFISTSRGGGKVVRIELLGISSTKLGESVSEDTADMLIKGGRHRRNCKIDEINKRWHNVDIQMEINGDQVQGKKEGPFLARRMML